MTEPDAWFREEEARRRLALEVRKIALATLGWDELYGIVEIAVQAVFPYGAIHSIKIMPEALIDALTQVGLHPLYPKDEHVERAKQILAEADNSTREA